MGVAFIPPVDLAKTPTTRALPEHICLSNGLNMLAPTHEPPAVTLEVAPSKLVRILIRLAGAGGSDSGKGAMNGTGSKDALELAKALRSGEAGLSFAAHLEGVDVLELNSKPTCHP